MKAVLFDLDGTLIDHFRIIYRCYDYAISKLGLPPVSYDKLKSSVGGSIGITFGKLMPEKHVDEAVLLFREEFDRIWHEDIEVLPGTEWILRELKAQGLKLAVFTNKEGDRSRNLLRHVGLLDHLDEVFGSLDTPWVKPQPEFTRHALSGLGTESSSACMIGDSPYDVASATCVDMPCFTVATGSHSMEQLQTETNAAGVFPDLFALGKSVFGLTNGQA